MLNNEFYSEQSIMKKECVRPILRYKKGDFNDEKSTCFGRLLNVVSQLSKR